MTEHHRFLLRLLMSHLEALEGLIDQLNARIGAAMAPFAAEVERLTTIPGVDRRTAEVVVAEIGPDMSRFPTRGPPGVVGGALPGQRPERWQAAERPDDQR